MVELATQADFSVAVEQVRQASHVLVAAGADAQSRLLEAVATAVEASLDDILEANTLDLEASLDMAVPERVLDWLKLTPERLQTTAKILRRLAYLGDPRGLLHPVPSRLSKAVAGYGQVVPLGVVALVYEAFPELAAIAAGLSLRTGNGLILKGSNEAGQTNQVILQALHQALDQVGLPQHCILSLTEEQGDVARSWLLQDPGVDLIIPYGRPGLVQQVVRQAGVPVLPTAIGNCYLYWSASGQLDTVTHMILDSHRGEPDAVNAIEKVLVHRGCSPSALAQLCHTLWDQDFEVLAHESLMADLPDVKLATAADWSRPFLGKTVALRLVEDTKTAAALINRYSSGHANAIATESYTEGSRFTQLATSAVIYVNASPRFVRNPAQAAAIALGMTAQRGRCSGFVGLSALLTTQHILQGLE
ncbi:aldehyde dehydrogenase family protein [Nodosilinea sp. LEGE 07298]|uniref:aldehyde dehydrogenase family protein n=1 Tax=Nodosilinea sp. LEGE 07298 TaxID=2777970 RepID=UPI00187E6B0A|nr:aldehyde dehydrogenase family protein [Nodosilinea sp. LEGE 07298]MBE9108739.1 aldehyde dehydrogenase family protein [Nodosilinea sp. LEGE 07298]